MNEITFDELGEWSKDSYVLIDIRDEGLTAYGMIPGAVHFPIDEFTEKAESGSLPFEKTKKLVLYCQIGRKSREIDEDLLEGRECYSLEGGYIASFTAKS